MDSDGPGEDVDGDGHIFPCLLGAGAFDTKVEAIVVFTVEVFLGRVVLYLVGIASQGKVVTEVDIHDSMSRLMITDDESRVVAGIIAIDQSEEREVVVGIALSDDVLDRRVNVFDISLCSPCGKRTLGDGA